MVYETAQTLRFSLLPPEHDENDAFCVHVQHRGNGRYAVNFAGFDDHQMSRSGNWDWWPGKDFVTDEWLDEHRFDLDEARQLAELHVGDIVVNGWIVKDGEIVHSKTGKPLKET